MRHALLLVLVACATPNAEPIGTSGQALAKPIKLPECTLENLHQELPIEGGSSLWCVETESRPSPRWEQRR